MRITLNKRRTSAVLKRHGGYDNVKRRSWDIYVGSLPLLPTVPDGVPETLRIKLSREECDELEHWLASLRGQRKSEVARSCIPAALTAIERLVAAIALGDVVVTKVETAALRGELGTALGLLEKLIETEAKSNVAAEAG